MFCSCIGAHVQGTGQANRAFPFVAQSLASTTQGKQMFNVLSISRKLVLESLQDVASVKHDTEKRKLLRHWHVVDVSCPPKGRIRSKQLK